LWFFAYRSQPSGGLHSDRQRRSSKRRPKRTEELPFLVGGIRLVQCPEFVTEILTKPTALDSIQITLTYAWPLTLGNRFVVVASVTIRHHVLIEPDTCVEFGLGKSCVESAARNNESGKKERNRTCRRSHLFRNSTILTSASSLFETKDFHNNSESSNRLTRGSWEFDQMLYSFRRVQFSPQPRPDRMLISEPRI